MMTLYIKNILIILCIITSQNCSKKPHSIGNKTNEKQTFEQEETKALTYLNQKSYDLAINTLETAINKYPDHIKIPACKLLLADLFFTTKDYTAASYYYQHFANFYPSHEKYHYALYKTVLSHHYQTLKIDCDQSMTEKTLQLCKANESFLQGTLFHKDLKDIEKTCRTKLFDKEVYIYNFYLRQNDNKSAENRLNLIKNNKELLQDDQDLKAHVKYLECKLAKQQKNKSCLVTIIEDLATNHPQSPYRKMSESLLKTI